MVVTLAVARPPGKPPGSTPPYFPPAAAARPPAAAAPVAAPAPAAGANSKLAQGSQPSSSGSSANKATGGQPAQSSQPSSGDNSSNNKPSSGNPHAQSPQQQQQPASSTNKAVANQPAQQQVIAPNSNTNTPTGSTNSRPGGTGFRAPGTPAVPRGLVGAGASSNRAVMGPQRPTGSLVDQQKSMYSQYIPRNAPVRTFSAIWPFNINIYGGATSPRDIRNSRSRVGVISGGPSRDSSNRGLLRRLAAGNERGTVLSGASAQQPAAHRGIAPLPDIPRSQLYDPYAPVTVSAEVELNVPDNNKLAVNVTVNGQSKDAAGVAVLAPQSKQGSISVSVKDASGAAVANAEVTLMVVDKAILDLMPYELQVRRFIDQCIANDSQVCWHPIGGVIVHHTHTHMSSILTSWLLLYNLMILY